MQILCEFDTNAAMSHYWYKIRRSALYFMAEIPQEGKLIGKISHYFSKISVAVVDLTDALKIGDTIRIVGGNTDFTQQVGSMEVEHNKVQEARKGDSVGMEVNEKVREGYSVYKI